MRLLVSWLRDFVDVTASAEEIGEGLGLRGFELAAIEPFGDGDAVIDFEITANRPDCLSVIGLAREVSTLYDLPLKPLLDPPRPRPTGCRCRCVVRDGRHGAVIRSAADPRPAGAAFAASRTGPCRSAGFEALHRRPRIARATGIAEVRWAARLDHGTPAGRRPSISSIVDITNYV
jgi:hypothetical protein